MNRRTFFKTLLGLGAGILASRCTAIPEFALGGSQAVRHPAVSGAGKGLTTPLPAKRFTAIEVAEAQAAFDDRLRGTFRRIDFKTPFIVNGYLVKEGTTFDLKPGAINYYDGPIMEFTYKGWADVF